MPQTLARYILPPPPSRADLVAAIGASLRLLELAVPRITFPLFASVFRAPLGNCNHSLHLVGPSGVYKSEIAALAQQHFGAGLMRKNLPANWASTANANESLAFSAKDTILTIDDFTPRGSQADVERYHANADRLFRAAGNHSGRQRMNRDGGLRPEKPPRCSINATGEEIPRGHSVQARLLVLEVGSGDVDTARLTACQADAAAGLNAQSMAGYVQWLASRYDEIQRRMPAEISELRRQALVGSHARTPEIVANLAFGLQCFLAYAVDVGALTDEEAAELWARGWQALLGAAAVQDAHQAAAEPAGRYLDLLRAVMLSGRAHVTSKLGYQPARSPEAWSWMIRPSSELPDIWQPLGRWIGWIDGDHLYLDPLAAYAAVQQMARDQGGHFAVEERTLRQRLEQQGLLASREKTRLTVRRSYGGARYDVLHLDAKMVVPVDDGDHDQTSAAQRAASTKTASEDKASVSQPADVAVPGGQDPASVPRPVNLAAPSSVPADAIDPSGVVGAVGAVGTAMAG